MQAFDAQPGCENIQKEVPTFFAMLMSLYLEFISLLSF
jgi:hypothetical protein